MEAHEFEPTVKLYDPADSRFQPSSPTYIGPKKKQ
jgi:hypothetical protein